LELPSKTPIHAIVKRPYWKITFTGPGDRGQGRHIPLTEENMNYVNIHIFTRNLNEGITHMVLGCLTLLVCTQEKPSSFVPEILGFTLKFSDCRPLPAREELNY
jgi:hypothetical protein